MVMSKKGAPEFKMRQYLFSAQVGVLLSVPQSTLKCIPSLPPPLCIPGPHSRPKMLGSLSLPDIARPACS